MLRVRSLHLLLGQGAWVVSGLGLGWKRTEPRFCSEGFGKLEPTAASPRGGRAWVLASRPAAWRRKRWRKAGGYPAARPGSRLCVHLWGCWGGLWGAGLGSRVSLASNNERSLFHPGAPRNFPNPDLRRLLGHPWQSGWAGGGQWDQELSVCLLRSLQGGKQESDRSNVAAGTDVWGSQETEGLCPRIPISCLAGPGNSEPWSARPSLSTSPGRGKAEAKKEPKAP